MQIAPGSVVGGKHRLERPLSRGGMGSIWVAQHVKLGSRVAVKFMAPAYATSPEFVTRFEREARIAATLQSPHVVHVHDYGIDDGVPYLVMELLEGEDFGARLKRVGRLSVKEAAYVLVQVGKAIRRAHKAGLVHRDLKPGNLFLASHEDDEIVKVLDFGIVKETGGDPAGGNTRTGMVLGSPYYMSPEQARGLKDLDHRSDLWSLGVIFFHAITGQCPFRADQMGEVFAKIMLDPIPLATKLAPSLPAAIDGFFAKALARDRAQRFQSVEEMMNEIRRIAGLEERRSLASYGDIDARDLAATGTPLPRLTGAATAPRLVTAGTAETAATTATDAGPPDDLETTATTAGTAATAATAATDAGPPDALETLTSTDVASTRALPAKRASRAWMALGVGVPLLLGVGGVLMPRLRAPDADRVGETPAEVAQPVLPEPTAAPSAAEMLAVPVPSGSSSGKPSAVVEAPATEASGQAPLTGAPARPAPPARSETSSEPSAPGGAPPGETPRAAQPSAATSAFTPSAAQVTDRLVIQKCFDVMPDGSKKSVPCDAPMPGASPAAPASPPASPAHASQPATSSHAN